MYTIETLNPLHQKIRALRHPIRREILEIIRQEAPVCVTDIYVRARLEQSVCSLHLKILRDQGYIKSEKQGKLRFYHLNEKAIKDTLEKV